MYKDVICDNSNISYYGGQSNIGAMFSIVLQLVGINLN